jgi:hypothetical protein
VIYKINSKLLDKEGLNNLLKRGLTPQYAGG